MHENCDELELRCGARRLAACAWGAVGSPPVLALHGWLDNAASFARLAPLLSGHRVIALDLPGHGRSGHRPAGCHYHFVDFVADAVAAVDALELQRFALLGHSLGAGVACLVAAVIPERVTHVALIEGLGPYSARAADGPAQLRRSIAEMAAVPGKRTPSYATLEEAARARGEAGGLGHEAALALTRRGSIERDGRLTWRSDPQLRVKSPQYLSEAQVLGYLRAIRAPALLVRARSGLLHGRPGIEARCAAIDGLRIEELDGGHHLHLDTPQPVAHVLRGFLGD